MQTETKHSFWSRECCWSNLSSAGKSFGVGQPDGDSRFAAATKRAAKRFGGTIVVEKEWNFRPAARRTAQCEVPIFPQDIELDVPIVADEIGEFGEAATRTRSSDFQEIAANRRSRKFALARFKGQKLTFRDWNECGSRNMI